MTTRSRPRILASQGQVASWLGVTTAAVSNWAVRYPREVPVPSVIITSPNGTEVAGWDPEQRGEWEAFAAARQHRRSAGRWSEASQQQADTSGDE